MTYDFAPLFRTAVGFDRLARLVDTLPQDVASYPPYNIEKAGEDSYRVSLAVAGFGPENIEVTVKDNALVVAGNLGEEPKGEFLHRGIAARGFLRRFVLAENMVVEGAELINGLLSVSLRRVVPENAKPRRIEITTPSITKQVAGTVSASELPQAA